MSQLPKWTEIGVMLQGGKDTTRTERTKNEKSKEKKRTKKCIDQNINP